MANPLYVTLTLSAAVSNGIALSQSGTANTALTLNGSFASAGIAALTPARRVLVTSAGNDASITFKIVGTDRYGNAISETLQGSSGSEYTKQDFGAVTIVTPSGNTASTVTVGTNSIGSSPWFTWNMQIAPFQIGFACESTGATYTVEHTMDDPNSQQANSVQPNSNFPPVAWPDGVLYNQSGNARTNSGLDVWFASRLTITSGTSAVVMQAIQAGIANY